MGFFVENPLGNVTLILFPAAYPFDNPNPN